MPRNPPTQLACAICSSSFLVHGARKHTARYCSMPCRDIGRKQRAAAEKEKDMLDCPQCLKRFYVKPFQRQNRIWGNFCSRPCLAEHKKTANQFAANPNWKGRNVDSDGYRLYVPPATLQNSGLRRMKLHQALACNAFGIQKMPKGVHVHHRDCDVLNNTPSNLVVMSINNHQWLHKQFGTATLAAFMRGEVDLHSLVSWSDDPLRAEYLLMIDIQTQAAIMKAVGAPATDLARFVKTFMPVRVDLEVVDELSSVGSTGA